MVKQAARLAEVGTRALPMMRRHMVLKAVMELILQDESNVAVVAQKLGFDTSDVQSALRCMKRDARAAILNVPKKKAPGQVQSLFTDEIKDSIISWITKGTMKVTAARASGVSCSTFNDWMARPEPEYRDFHRRVEEAVYEARGTREVEVFEADPLSWLRHNAKDKGDPNDPGWTETHRIEQKTTITGSIHHTGTIQLEPLFPKLSLTARRELLALVDAQREQEALDAKVVQGRVVPNTSNQTVGNQSQVPKQLSNGTTQTAKGKSHVKKTIRIKKRGSDSNG